MRSIKKIIAIGLSTVMIFTTAGCGLIEKSPEAKLRTAVAKVNGEKITKGEFDKRLGMQTAQLEAMYGKEAMKSKEVQDYINSMKPQVLDSMVLETIAIQKAKELKIVPDEATLSAEISKRYQESTKNFGGEDKLKEYLSAVNVTVDDYKEIVRRNIIFDKLYEDVTKNVKVTESDEQTYYHTNIFDYTEKPDKMEVSHILVAKEEDAKKIKAEIDNGMSFADAAKKYGTDGTKETGGSLGEVYYSNKYNQNPYDNQFLTAAIKAETNKVTGPVQTQFGYHLILVTKREEYPKKSFESVKKDINSILTEQKKQEEFQKIVQGWQEKAKITKYTDRL